MAEKKDIEEKLSDFERKGNHRLELVRNWIIEANQAKNFALENNFSEMKNFLKTIGSNRRLAAGKLAIDFKNPWNYLAEMPTEARGEAPSEANHTGNKLWWTRRDSNPRSCACHAHAFPLSYRPSEITFTICFNSINTSPEK